MNVYVPDQVTEDDIDAICDVVGLWPGAWDMLCPKKIIAATWNRLQHNENGNETLKQLGAKDMDIDALKQLLDDKGSDLDPLAKQQAVKEFADAIGIKASVLYWDTNDPERPLEWVGERAEEDQCTTCVSLGLLFGTEVYAVGYCTDKKNEEFDAKVFTDESEATAFEREVRPPEERSDK